MTKIDCLMRCGVLTLLLLATACGSEGDVPGYDALLKHVEKNRVGQDSDHWIEMGSIGGGWERVGLIFGYIDDYAECQKAIAGLKLANYAREYRCVPAN